MSLTSRVSHLLGALIPQSPAPVAEWERVTRFQWQEWESDTRFSFPIQKMGGELHQSIVTTILAAAERAQDREKLVDLVIGQFGMSAHDATRAIDRVLGGVVRAAIGMESSGADVDPLGAAAFTLAWRDRPLGPAIRAQWGAWKPGDGVPRECDW
ncbi:MAG: hypothetical protein QM755_05405 [Luteolibacter sp.]